jgi:ATP-dependent Clp protease ATP-binding subunit ClpA
MALQHTGETPVPRSEARRKYRPTERRDAMAPLWLKLKQWWFRRQHPHAEVITDEAKEVFREANQAALNLSSPTVGTGHILLGIARKTDLLTRLGVPNADLESRILCAMKNTQDHLDDPREPAKHVLQAAIDEARLVHLREIDAQLLLAGLCRLKGLMAYHFLCNLGLSLERVRSLRKANN